MFSGSSGLNGLDWNKFTIIKEQLANMQTHLLLLNVLFFTSDSMFLIDVQDTYRKVYTDLHHLLDFHKLNLLMNPASTSTTRYLCYCFEIKISILWFEILKFYFNILCIYSKGQDSLLSGVIREKYGWGNLQRILKDDGEKDTQTHPITYHWDLLLSIPSYFQ